MRRRRRAAAAEWIEALGRVGFAAKGIVYALVGVLALRLAVGAGGATAGQKDVLPRIREAPFGDALLLAIAIGLFGYALFRAVQAVFDPDHVGRDAKGVGTRVGYAVSSLLHATLGASALRLAMGRGGGASSEASTVGWTARLMSQPFGRWLVGIVGCAILVAAVAQFVRAYKANFMRQTKREEMEPETQRWLERLGRAGYAARGVVFAIAGVFALVAAYRVRPGEARGLGGALAALAGQPFGQVLLGVVALGLVAYGAYALALSRYRRMHV